MQNPYQKSMLFLTYIQGPHVNEWVVAQHQWLFQQVSAEGIDPLDLWLWDEVEYVFTRNFANTMEQEKA